MVLGGSMFYYLSDYVLLFKCHYFFMILIIDSDLL